MHPAPQDWLGLGGGMNIADQSALPKHLAKVSGVGVDPDPCKRLGFELFVPAVIELVGDGLVVERDGDGRASLF